LVVAEGVTVVATEAVAAVAEVVAGTATSPNKPS
jgi:hypothetical protein